jgi:hypothetical protein
MEAATIMAELLRANAIMVMSSLRARHAALVAAFATLMAVALVALVLVDPLAPFFARLVRTTSHAVVMAPVNLPATN